jgi:hypothetical protein
MRTSTRDLIATVLVAVAGLVYLMWAVGAAVPGTGSTRVAGIVVLALGFAASASAVVPTFLQLLHGSRVYLAATSLIGLAAFIGGLMTIVSASRAGFALLIATTVTLWLISTVHHRALARAPATRTCVYCEQPIHAATCEVCGYDLIEQTRSKVMVLPRV